MNYNVPITIDRIEKAIIEKDKDYILFLKNIFYHRRPSLFGKIIGIQLYKEKIRKKHTKAVIKFDQHIVYIYITGLKIEFEYTNGILYELRWKLTPKIIFDITI